MKKYLKIIGIIVITVTAIIITAYFLSGGNNKKLPEPTTFIFGERHIIQKEVVNEQGGQFIVKNTGTELDGIKIIVPAGSVPNKTQIEIGYYTGSWKQTTNNKFSLPLIVNFNKHLNEMGQPIEIYNKAEMAFAVDKDSGRLEPYTTVNNITHTFRPKNIIAFSDIVPVEKLKGSRLKLSSFQGNCDDTGPAGETKIIEIKRILPDTGYFKIQTEVTCCVKLKGDIELIENGNIINFKYKEAGEPCQCLCKGVLEYTVKGLDKRNYQYQLNGEKLE